MPYTVWRMPAITLGLAALAASLLACVAEIPADAGRAPDAATATRLETAAATQADENTRPAGWTEASHSNDVDPNYDVVFPRDTVNTITITIAPDDWATMQANMEEIYGEGRDAVKALAEMTDEERAEFILKQIEEAAAGAATAPLGAEFTLPSPMWVPATISFQGQDWTHVGVRYKGASSLSPWMNGDLRLPFKFDFDEFEDEYPAIKNQRFFGFKELSLANNYEDLAGMRDILVYEILAEAGLPSVRTAPYEIVLDYGEGTVRLGLYTMIEVVDETGIPAYFGSDDGNIYEGNGFGASLAKENSAEAIETSFEKKNNEDEADWSDILALYDVLHDEKRTSDPEAWRADLEAIFDVDGFLEWLGIAAFVGHGDTYGAAGHNFYIYNNPETGKLTWVSWDHNVTFRNELLPFLVLDKSIVGDSWPLIRYLLDDPVYWDRYVELMAENFTGVLAPDALTARIRTQAEVIAPVATLDMSPEEYAAAVQEIIDFVEARATDVETFLTEQEAESGAAAGDAAAATGDAANRPPGWTEASHSNDVDPSYDVVFPIDAINTLTITIAPDDWATMQADMEDIYAPSLFIRQGMLAAGPDLSKEERDKLFLELVRSRAAEQPAGASPLPSAEQATGAVAEPAAKEQIPTLRSPMWVPSTVSFQGQQWTHVGVRYKGASSLSPWIMGEMRLPFKFDFDEFEDDYPAIKNQRFFGFKELSLANNYEDPTGIRDILTYELLGEAGLPSLRTAPYEIMLDYGEGPVRLGLYTMVEVIDDTGVPNYFGSDDGNIYEGEGWGVSLASQDSHLLEDSFEKKNNEDEADWSDIWALYDVLNSEQRTSDPAAWRADLEAIFDVDGFLEWLGLAAVVGHADTYGKAYHNLYLYNDPGTGKLTWFSWDHNVTFLEYLRPILSLDKADVTDAWPLIRYLLDDPVYWDRYVELMAEKFTGVLAPEAIIAKIRTHAEVIAPVATLDMSPEEYAAAVQEIVDFVEMRAEDVEDFLATQK